MSKSLGNVVDPVEVIEQYGTDALRLTLATGACCWPANCSISMHILLCASSGPQWHDMRADWLLVQATFVF